MYSFDLNADLGEGAGTDNELLDIISSASVACGGHAGDDATMRATLRAAKARRVACGAHPGFDDREHFGRRRLNLPRQELQAQIARQLINIQNIADQEKVVLHYVKLHGALANMTAEDQKLAEAAFEVVQAHNSELAILALENSAQVEAAKKLGLKVLREAYADRAYVSNGLLVSRDVKGALITKPEKAVKQCLRLAQKGEIVSIDGTVIKSGARSICVHGDSPDAVEMARQISGAMKNAGIYIGSPFDRCD